MLLRQGAPAVLLRRCDSFMENEYKLSEESRFRGEVKARSPPTRNFCYGSSYYVVYVARRLKFASGIREQLTVRAAEAKLKSLRARR